MIKKNAIYIFFALSLISIFAMHHNRLIAGPHHTRQAQTANTTSIFVDEGIHLFYPKVSFFGRPGYNLLELPLYQAASATIVKHTPLRVEQASRLLSFIAGLFFILGFLKLNSLLFEKNETSKFFSVALPLCSPLLLGLSYWISIELVTASLTLWALVYWIRFVTEKRWHFSLLLFFAFFSLSVLIKPNYVFAISPFFIFFGIKLFRKKLKLIVCLLPLAISMFFLAAWIKHANVVNESVHNHFGVLQGFSHYFSNRNIFEYSLRIFQRIVLYVVGPGIVMGVFGLVFFAKPKKIKLKKYFQSPWVHLSFLSIFIYLAIFQNLNFVHNYYQLPVLLPFLVLTFEFIRLFSFKMSQKIYLAVAIIFSLHLIIAYQRLIKNEEEIKDLVIAVKNTFQDSSEDWFFISGEQIDLIPTIAYYVGGYSKEISLREPRDGTRFLALCKSENKSCISKMIEKLPCKNKTRTPFWWICEGK